MYKALIIILLFPFFSFSQDFKFGIELGPSVNFLRGSYQLYYTYKPEPTIKYFAGLNFEYQFTENFSLKTRLIFENKGGLISYKSIDGFDSSQGNVTRNFTYEYISIPILIKYKLGKQKRFYLTSGFSLGYLLQRRLRINYFDQYQSELIYSTSNTQKIDFGILMGFGWDIQISEKINFTMVLNNNLGLIDTSNLETYGEGDIKSNSSQLLFGFSYQFGKSK